MARVFAKPTYGTKADFSRSNPARASVSYAKRNPVSSHVIAALVADDEHDVEEIMSLVQDPTLDTVHVEVVNRIVADAAIATHRAVLTGADATSEAMRRILIGGVTSAKEIDWATIAEAGRTIAAAGCVAGWASPGPAVSAIRDVKIDSVIAYSNTRAVDLISLADNIRLGCACPSAKCEYDRIRKSVRQPSWDANLDNLSISRTRVARMLGARDIYAVGNTLIWATSWHVLVLDSTQKSNLASCVYSIGMWAIAGQGAKSSVAALQFVRDALIANRNLKTWELARSLKSEYAVIVASAQEGADQELFTTQIEGLDAECAQIPIRVKGKRFSEVMGRDHDAINFGTVWNVLPPADIDGHALCDAFASKCDKVKPADDDAWDDFIAYASMVASAHYVYGNRNNEVRWYHAGDTEPSWASECRAGTLTYARAGTYDWIVGSIPWVRTMENWAYGAQDVTHVHASADLTVDNELSYAIEHGPKLSKTWDPAEIRDMWCDGAIPGKRTLYMAGKSENTKFGAKVRETMSADDVLRECLSEIDQNMTTLGSVVHGVTMRRGRSSVERMIGDVITHGGSSRVLLSLDVSGWSPNMIRRKELEFIDRLMSMYAIPDGMRASVVFKDLTVRFRRGSVDRTIDMVDGSVQGFFGTADTIMHSLMAQWAFKNGREAKVFSEHAKMNKVVLIDDILCSLDGIGGSVSDAVTYFTHEYQRLGFTVDVVKTLAAPNIGTFLNRVYTPTGEIVTWAKIAAKSDREWDRPVVGLVDEVSSVFGGFAGAVDRGMDIVTGYTLACVRTCSRVAALHNNAWFPTEGFVHLSAFCPLSWGGIGIPSVTEWITGGSCGAGPSRIAGLATVVRQAAAGAYTRAPNMAGQLRALSEAPVVRRRASAAFATPNAVKSSVAIASDDTIKDAVRTAMVKKFGNSMFSRFFGLVPGDDVDAACASFIAEGVFDAPVAEALWACTPYAVADGAIARFASSAEGLRWIPRRALTKCLRSIRAADKRTLKGHAELASSPADNGVIDGSAMIRGMLEREGVCHGMRNVVLPSPADILGFAPDAVHGHLRAHIPYAESVHDMGEGRVASRTFTSSTVRVGVPATESSGNPIISAFRDLVHVASCAESINGSAAAAYDFICDMWGTAASAPLVYVVPSDNPFRALKTYCAPSHSIRAAPNYAGSIAVSYSSGLTDFQNVRKVFDWSTLKAFVMGACLVDASLGLCRGSNAARTRLYVVRNTATVTREIPGHSPGPGPSRRVRAAVELGAEFADDFADQLVVAGSANDDGDGVQGFSQLASLFSAGKVIDNRAGRRPMGMADFLMSLASTATIVTPTDATVDVSGTKSAPARVLDASIGEWTSKFRRMDPVKFYSDVATYGGDFGHVLGATRAGAALWKVIRHGGPARCAEAMRIVCSMTGPALSGDSMRAWRESCARRHAKKSEDTKLPASVRYKSHYISHIALLLGRQCPSNSSDAYALVAEGMARATNAILERSTSLRVEAEPRGRKAYARRARCISSIAAVIPDDFAQRDIILEAANAAWGDAYGWVLADYVEAERKTAAVAEHTSSAAAAYSNPAVNNYAHLMGINLVIGGEMFAEDDAVAAPGANVDVADNEA